MNILVFRNKKIWNVYAVKVRNFRFVIVNKHKEYRDYWQGVDIKQNDALQSLIRLVPKTAESKL